MRLAISGMPSLPVCDRMNIVLHPVCPTSVRTALGESSRPRIETPSPEELPAALLSADVLVTYKWSDDWLIPNLRMIQSISVGVDQFPLELFEDRGVVLTSARGCHGPQVSEHAFALLLAVTRGVGLAMRNAEARSWRPIQGDEIAGMTLGVLGLGTVGEAIAQKASAWGLTVIGTKRNSDDYSGVASWVVGPDRTREVFARADIVVSVLPDTPETVGIIDAGCLEALDGGYFINVGRGTSLREDVLLEAVDQGWVKGAGLDVFDPEPLPPTSRLWGHPKIVLTAHSAGFSPRYGERLLGILRSNVAALGSDGPWINRVV